MVVFAQIDVTLLLATSALIVLLLLYRSPVIALVPLLVVALAYVVVAAFVYELVEAGAITVNEQVTGILIILMFGAGTDYCLLLVARAREELRRNRRHEALAEALHHTSPAILSGGGTVVAAMLVLLVADLESTRALGQVALGVAVTVLAGLTLLPALLAILGRRSFWPAVPQGHRARAGARSGVASAGSSPAGPGSSPRRPPGRSRWLRSATSTTRPVARRRLPRPGRGDRRAGALAASFPAGEGATTDVLVATPRAGCGCGAARRRSWPRSDPAAAATTGR